MVAARQHRKKWADIDKCLQQRLPVDGFGAPLDADKRSVNLCAKVFVLRHVDSPCNLVGIVSHQLANWSWNRIVGPSSDAAVHGRLNGLPMALSLSDLRVAGGRNFYGGYKKGPVGNSADAANGGPRQSVVLHGCDQGGVDGGVEELDGGEEHDNSVRATQGTGSKTAE